MQVFAAANDVVGGSEDPRPYEIAVVANQTSVMSCAGLGLFTGPLTAPEMPLDTLVIAGGPGVNDACHCPAQLAWIKARAAKARRIASVCSGAFLLAEAGLLDGRRAVTHWGRCAEFARRFPNVHLDRDPIFINDGNIWTSAGVTAGIDLMLALVEADLGHRVALAVARELVVFLKRPGGQAQFSNTLALQSTDECFERLHSWIVENLCNDLSVACLARTAGMSERSFVRHYRQTTGMTPARAVESIRIEVARHMLEDGQTVKRVARACGFGSEETMRRAFLRILGVTAQAYGRRFSAG